MIAFPCSQRFNLHCLVYLCVLLRIMSKIGGRGKFYLKFAGDPLKIIALIVFHQRHVFWFSCYKCTVLSVNSIVLDMHSPWVITRFPVIVGGLGELLVDICE